MGTRATLLIVMFATALGTAGCGGSSSAGSPSGGPAADRAVARSINLRSADLAGWRESANTQSAADQATADRLVVCAGAPARATTEVADVSSPNFEQDQTEVSSRVVMVRSHADGLADLRALESPRLASCVQQIAVPYLRSQMPAGVLISGLSVSTFQPGEHLPDSFGYRVTATLQTVSASGTESLPLDIRVIGFLVGRAQVELSIGQQGGGAAPPVEQRLVRVLDQRARQAM